MSTRRALVAVLALLAIAVVAWRLLHEPDAPADNAPPVPGLARSAAVASSPPPAERSTLADALNSPTTDTRADLQLLADIVDAFRSNFPRSGNPVGSNAEITAALTGRNPLGLALIPPKHSAINKAGELCDRWGTPFFFHAESATHMEFRSAGPDRKMWTDDDVIFAP